MGKVNNGPREQKIRHAAHRAIADGLTEKVLEIRHSIDPEYQPPAPLMNMIAINGLASLLAGANWSSKITPEVR